MHMFTIAVTDDGMIGALKRFLPDEGLLNAATRGPPSIARKDVEGFATLLMKAKLEKLNILSIVFRAFSAGSVGKTCDLVEKYCKNGPVDADTKRKKPS